MPRDPSTEQNPLISQEETNLNPLPPLSPMPTVRGARASPSITLPLVLPQDESELSVSSITPAALITASLFAIDQSLPTKDKQKNKLKEGRSLMLIGN